MLHIVPIPAFEDNYIWVLHNQRHAVVIDPGVAAPVIDYCTQKRLKLSAILVTHHHSDHINGVANLLAFETAPVYAPSYESFHFAHTALQEGDTVNLPELNVNFNVVWLPGHTLGHIAYVNDDYLFCGDVLFSAGCGRLFEGTPAQMLHSLNRIKKLPPQTQVFCTHEYTSKNIAFALTIEPDNLALIARENQVIQLRLEKQPSLPTNIALELETNPFLRCNLIKLKSTFQQENTNELAVFTIIRNLRNHY